MMKKVFMLLAILVIFHISVFADTVTTSVNNVPIQEGNNSSRVIALVPAGTELSKSFETGDFFNVIYNDLSGYMYKAYTEEGSNSNFLDIAIARKKYVRDREYIYSQSGPKVPAENSKYMNGRQVIDCSSYVSDVMYYYGQSKNWPEMMQVGRQRSTWFRAIGSALRDGHPSTYFTRVNSVEEMQAGDILCYYGHVEIYAGQFDNGRPVVYSCGSTSAIQASNLVTRATRDISKIEHILRVK